MIKLEELSYNDEIVLTIGIDENDKSIVLIDKNRNSIKFGSNGVFLDCEKDINISSKGNIKIDGLSISINAKTSLTAKGNASAELSASGQTTLKGAMVMIN